jgi:hypothetical protein
VSKTTTNRQARRPAQSTGYAGSLSTERKPLRERLAAQGGGCAICGDPAARHVDRCPATGAVRGVLCRDCARALAALDDDPAHLRAAAAYLQRAARRLAPRAPAGRIGRPRKPDALSNAERQHRWRERRKTTASDQRLTAEIGPRLKLRRPKR